MLQPHLAFGQINFRWDGSELLTVNGGAASSEDAVFLCKPSCHCHRFFIAYFDSIVNQLSAGFEIGSDAIDPNAFDDRIDLRSPSRAFPLQVVKHDSVFDSIEQSAALRIRQDDAKILELWFEESSNTCNGPTCACTSDESIKLPTTLIEDFRSGALVVSLPIGLILELVGEVTSTWAFGICSMVCSKASSAVDEMHGINDGCRGDSIYNGPKLQEEI